MKDAAIYYFNHSRWCKRHGYSHEAAIYLEDSWYFLFEAAFEGSLL